MGIEISTYPQRDERSARARAAQRCAAPEPGPVTYTKYGEIRGPVVEPVPADVTAAPAIALALEAGVTAALETLEGVAGVPSGLPSPPDACDVETPGGVPASGVFEPFNPATAEIDAVLGGTVSEVRWALERLPATDPAAAVALLERLIAAEARGKGRAGVLSAIERRAAALRSAGTSTEPAP